MIAGRCVSRTLVLTAFATLPALGLACSREAPSGDVPASEIVARVDGQAVTRAELEDLAEQLRSRRPSRPAPDQGAALEAWIESRLLQREVEARGLAGTDAYRARRAAIQARARRSLQQLARDTVVASLAEGLVLDEQELRARYAETRERFLTTRLHLRQITVSSKETIVAIRKRLAQGEAFEELARQANLDPALRQKGGDLGWLDQRKLPTSVIGPAHRLVEIGEVSEPFEDREHRFNLVQLVDRQESAHQSFESVRERLDQELRILRSRELLAQLLAERRRTVNVEWLRTSGR